MAIKKIDEKNGYTNDYLTSLSDFHFGKELYLTCKICGKKIIEKQLFKNAIITEKNVFGEYLAVPIIDYFCSKKCKNIWMLKR